MCNLLTFQSPYIFLIIMLEDIQDYIFGYYKGVGGGGGGGGWGVPGESHFIYTPALQPC